MMFNIQKVMNDSPSSKRMLASSSKCDEVTVVIAVFSKHKVMWGSIRSKFMVKVVRTTVSVVPLVLVLWLMVERSGVSVESVLVHALV